MGIIAVILGGLSSALWGSLASISYHQSSFKQVLKDFFQVKDSLANYCLVLVFLLLDFSPLALVARSPLNRWSCQWCSFQSSSFGGIEEIGWRYFLSTNFGGKNTLSFSYFDHLLAWSSWHLFLLLH